MQFTEKQQQFRQRVRAFLQHHVQKGTFTPTCDAWLSRCDPAFSKLLANEGWIGMIWPKQYGGQERSALERYILTEELLASGAPVAAHWFADRQTGPLLLRYGTEEQRAYFLPKIAAAECFFAIGLSEPNSGSDLASIQTSATKVEGGWLVNGAKTWTSNAQHADYAVTLVRTSREENKHDGLSQLIISLKQEGVTISPIRYLTGAPHFNDVYLDNVFVPDDRVVGTVGNGWVQGLAELAYERSGPERILSTFLLLQEAIKELKRRGDEALLQQAMPLVAQLWSLRNLSINVAMSLEAHEDVSVTAALVKMLGTQFEQRVPEVVRTLIHVYPQLQSEVALDRYMAESTLHAPGFTIRGGTTEVLYGILAKEVLRR